MTKVKVKVKIKVKIKVKVKVKIKIKVTSKRSRAPRAARRSEVPAIRTSSGFARSASGPA